MKMIEMKIMHTEHSYFIHVVDECEMSLLSKTLIDQLGLKVKDALIYHFESGRFLPDDSNVVQCGIESGDRLLLAWR